MVFYLDLNLVKHAHYKNLIAKIPPLVCACQSEGLFIRLSRIIKRVNNQLRMHPANHNRPVFVCPCSSMAMSISSALRTATRSAYRDVLRAASVTFAGNVCIFIIFWMS
jgi:hypothetical protein